MSAISKRNFFARLSPKALPRHLLAVWSNYLTPVFFYTRAHARKIALIAVITVVMAVGVGLNVAEPAQTAAATNSTINFQARLETAAGAIVPDGNYNVQFKLYSASSGGSALWTESYLNSSSQGIEVANGYLTANLGSITSFPGSINWDQELWLTMNIGGTTTGTPSYDGEMNPRLALTALPYAFRAGELADPAGSGSLLDWNTQSGAHTLSLPNESGTLCSTGSVCSGYAAASGSGNYIQNGTSPQTANFNITGNGTVGGTLQAATVNATSAIQLNGTSINTAGTLTNVAYENQANDFTLSQTISASGGKTTLQLSSTGSNVGLTIGGDTNLYRSAANTLATDDNLTVGGVVTLAGGQAADITTAAGTVPNGITLKPGAASTATDGAGVTIEGGDNSAVNSGFTTSGGTLTLKGGDVSSNSSSIIAPVVGGSVVIQAGSATGTSGTGRAGGNVTIDAGSGANQNGTVSIGTTNSLGITIGRSGQTVTMPGTLNVQTGYKINGTSGLSSLTCSGGQLLQDATVSGGIVTGGSCASGGGSGVTTVGTLDSQTKSADGAVISGSSIYLQTADASNPGLVSTGTQTFAGAKTFSGSITGQNIIWGTRASAANAAFAATVSGDSFSRYQVLADGTILWGSGTVTADTNLYRSGADLLKTDDGFIVGTLGSGGNVALCSNSGQIGTCGTGTGAPFIQGGNSFGAQAVLGTNDNNSLAFRTNSGDRAILDTSGNLQFQQASTISTSSGALTIQGATSLTLQSTTTNAVNIDSGTTGAINIGTSSQNKTITIGNNSASGATQTINIGYIASPGALNTILTNINIGTASNSNATTTIQAGYANGSIQIGSLAAGATQTINIGTNTNSTQTVTIGSKAATSSTTTIQGGSGSTAINIVSGVGSGAVASGTINVTGGAASGSTGSTGGAINLAAGAGGALRGDGGSVVIQGGDAPGTLSGNGGNVTIRGGSSTSGTTGTISIGATNTSALTIGNTTASTALTLQGGTGSSALSLATGSGGTLKVGSSGVAGTIQIGNTTGAVAQTINLGNNATASSTSTVTVGSTIGSSTTTIQGGTGNINLLTNSSSAGVTVKTNTNSSTAFRVQNSSGNSLLNVDTSTGVTTLQPANISATQEALRLVDLGTGSDEGSYIRWDTGDQTDQARIGIFSDATGSNLRFYTNETNGSSGANVVFTLTANGAAIFQNEIDSTTAFQIQNAASDTPLFVVDSSNNRLYVGNPTADTTGTLLVLDTKNNSGDPTGVEGGMYFNSSTNSFRCYQDGAWQSCGPQNKSLTSDQSTTSSSFTDVTAMSFPISANTDYTISCNVVYTSASTTNGIKLAFNGPASPTSLIGDWGSYGASSTSITDFAAIILNGYNLSYPTSYVYASNSPVPSYIKMTVRNGSNAGDLVLRFASENGGTSVSVKTGTTCSLTQL